MNKNRYYLSSICWNVISVLTSGALLQTFLLEKGLSEQTVGFYFAAFQLLQLLILFLCSGLLDRMKNIISTTALVHLLDLPLLILLLVLCFVPYSFPVPVFLCGLVCYIAIGLYNILTYKIPYHVIDMKDYGKVLGKSGFLGSGFTLLLSLLLIFLQKKDRVFFCHEGYLCGRHSGSFAVCYPHFGHEAGQ